MRIIILVFVLFLSADLAAIATDWQEENEKAKAMLQQGNYAESERFLNNALISCPYENKPSLLMNLAMLQKRSGDLDAARKTLLQALDIANKIDDEPLKARVQNALSKLSNAGTEPSAEPAKAITTPDKLLKADVQMLGAFRFNHNSLELALERSFPEMPYC